MLSLSKYERTRQGVQGINGLPNPFTLPVLSLTKEKWPFQSVRAEPVKAHQQRLSPFVLSLSKHERTRQGVNDLYPLIC
ncbi:MAG: hypothetical protein LBD67_09050 [Candidatus Accumulibacter sp.]|nr:hypothetical protein [Accumulibacter sp.]